MGKTTKLPATSNKNKSIDDFVKEYGEGFKDAIFNHEDCKKIFDERIKAIKLPVSDDSQVITFAFSLLMPKLSDNKLNLSDVDGEYEQMIKLLTGPQSGEYTQHPGIFILMVNQIRANAGETYSNNLSTRLAVFNACTNVLNAIRDIHKPIRDNAITEFWDIATDDQKADIRAVAKHHANPSAGMPLSQGIQQFGR